MRKNSVPIFRFLYFLWNWRERDCYGMENKYNRIILFSLSSHWNEYMYIQITWHPNFLTFSWQMSYDSQKFDYGAMSYELREIRSLTKWKENLIIKSKFRFESEIPLHSHFHCNIVSNLLSNNFFFRLITLFHFTFFLLRLVSSLRSSTKWTAISKATHLGVRRRRWPVRGWSVVIIIIWRKG